VPEDGNLMYKPAVINHGMMRKYGLRTTVLRHILSARNYHCIELEMHASSKRNLQAVWVDRENYSQFNRQDAGTDDPFDFWLREQESQKPAALRSPWETPGWYEEAEQWFTDRLVEQDIQAKGSIQQFKAGVPVSCILRVATVQGQVYFKAAYSKPPGEARLTRILAEQWPDLVPRPLAVDEDRNWMVMPDFRMKKDNRVRQEHYPEFMRVLGSFQAEASERLDQWSDLDVPIMDLEFLVDSEGAARPLLEDAEAILTTGNRPLDQSEMERLGAATEGARQACKALAGPGIPNSLAHMDFRPDNWFVEEGRYRVLDWADTIVTHPFMSMCQSLDFIGQHGTAEPGQTGARPVSIDLTDAMQEAYLGVFENFASPTELNEALNLARTAYPLLRLCLIAFELKHVEGEGPHNLQVRNLLKRTARSMFLRRVLLI
jgi:hypothetical protein